MQVSRFKARCLGLLKRVRRTGESLTITLRGKPLAQVVPAAPPPSRCSVAASLRELHRLLEHEKTDLELPPRRNRPGTRSPFPD
ncbi:MAG: type II toxin-antitoxin system prevent-host-death family antitoxin [Verrucomicrobia bacterium]|nr:type II toxin-antitoxin system prevent-host-death family antitoxin [Verrucomicrobiota bacterium]